MADLTSATKTMLRTESTPAWERLLRYYAALGSIFRTTASYGLGKGDARQGVVVDNSIQRSPGQS